MGLEEVWLPILGYEDRYEVSNLGKVKSLKSNVILRGQSTKDGYNGVIIQQQKKRSDDLSDSIMEFI